MDTKYEWIIRRTVFAKQFGPTTPGNILVYDEEGQHAVVLRYEDEQLTFNGEYCDVGDDYTEYLAIMDEAVERYPHTIASIPEYAGHTMSCQCRGPGRGCLREKSQVQICPDCGPNRRCVHVVS